MWWLKLAWYTAWLIAADLTERKPDPICACPGCDWCRSTVAPHPCSRRPLTDHCCAECEVSHG